MGADIHCWAEVRKRDKWQTVGRIFENPYHNPENPVTIDEDGYEWNPILEEHPYSERNYDLFAILADVRNGYGFAMVETGDGFKPISPPCGMPSDATEHVKKQVKEYGSDGHSHSWLSLKEILDYDWSMHTHKRGYVTPEEFKVFLEKGKPEAWCGGHGGPKDKDLSNEDMALYIQSDDFRKIQTFREQYRILQEECSQVAKEHGNISNRFILTDKRRLDFWDQYLEDTPRLFTRVQWPVSYKDAAGETWWKAIEKLKTLGDPQDTRLIFFFDN